MNPKRRLKSLENYPALKHTRFSKIKLLVFALIFGAIGAYALFHSSAAIPMANVFISASGSDSGADCTRFSTPTSAPSTPATVCASALKAYQIAQCGDTIMALDGSYGPINIGRGLSGTNNSEAKNCAAGNNPVVLVPQSAATVATNFIISEPWITVDGFNIGQGDISIKSTDSNGNCYATSVTHATVKNMTAGALGILNASYVTIKNNSFGGVTSAESELHSRSQSCQVPDQNHITLDGNTWHDYYNIDGGNTHMECLQVDAGLGVGGTGLNSFGNSFYTIKNNRFQNCGQYDLFMSGNLHDFTIYNNYWDSPCSNQTISTSPDHDCAPLGSFDSGPTTPNGSPCTASTQDYYNINVTFNTFASYAEFGCNSTTGINTGNVYAYNIEPGSALDGVHCGANLSFVRTKNYVNGKTVCPGDVRAAVAFVNSSPRAYNYDLAAGSPGILALSPCPASAPSTDIYGNARQRAGQTACSPGAYEYVPLPTTTANVFVSPNGSDSGVNCKRFTTALANPDPSGSSLCATLDKAYQLASCGDTVDVAAGTFTSAQKFLTTSSKSCSGACNYAANDFSACVNFKPITSGSVNFNVSSGAIAICADYIELSGFTILKNTSVEAGTGATLSATSVQVGAGDNSCLPSGNPPHDIYIANMSYGGQAGIQGGAYNVWLVGGMATGTNNIPWQLGSTGNNGLTSGVHNSGIVGIEFQGYNFSNGSYPSHHMECLHMDFAGDSNTVNGNKFLDCPVYSIRIEAEGNPANHQDTQTNHLIENNFFDGQQLNFDCHDNNCVLTGNTVRANSFSSASFQPTNDCQLNAGATCNQSGDLYYGNIGGNCPSSASAFGLGWTSSYDVFTSNQSGICLVDSTSVYNASLNYVLPGSPSYNLDLSLGGATCSLVPANANGGWPSADIHNAQRPLNSGQYQAGASASGCSSNPDTPLPTVSISANPPSLTSGASSTLTWSSPNATSCTASGSWSGSRATSGSQSLTNLTASATYTLTCTGSGGSAQNSASITVNGLAPPPVISFKKGDCDHDGRVNLTDLSILLSHYNQNYSLADFDANSIVNIRDLSILLSNYGK